ncbi:MAG: hypothetical protein VKK98_09525 [Cyanobacteriota bacterium]|nr:hypothetical protein [Cyanobacteriota bacterium]
MSRDELSSHEAALFRLAGLQAELSRNHPELYRHLALHLQVLREHLLSAVHQACFHLVTRVHPHRYAALSEERRIRLQHRLQSLVRRTLTLLTVEQLACLSAELHLERQQQLLESIAQTQRSQASEEVPSGSVHLGMDLPLRSQAWSEPLTPDWIQSAIQSGEQEPETEQPCSDLPSEGAFSEDRHPQLPWIRSAASFPEEAQDSSLLPRNPILLLRWLEGVELALGRCLRDLSHAINVELLRHGVSSALLPLNLLDGVILGHVDSQAAPPGILRITLPFPGEDQNGSAIQASAILLRLSDLEHSHPPLRTCRNRLRQAVQQVRVLAREFLSLQRRLATLEAEALWLQDVQAVMNPLR